MSYRGRGRGYSRGRSRGRGRGYSRGRSRGDTEQYKYIDENRSKMILQPSIFEKDKLRDYLPDFNNLTTEKLKIHWKKFTEEQKVIGFYQQKHPYFGCFSNFYICDYSFDLPYELLGISDENKKYYKSPIKCTNSEKTIMLCKAALMNDPQTFDLIVKSENPSQIKKLGREVKNFDPNKYEKYRCQIAFECVYQKFIKGTDEMKTYLKLTNTAILAEAAYRDKIWGIGLGVNQYISKPAEWNGTNILGWALMETRARIFS